MAYGVLSIALMAAVLYFAVVGVRLTIANYRESHGLDMFRDLLKYLVLFISVLITCLGLSGVLGLLLDTQNVDYYSKLDAARWLAFIVVGVPLTTVMATWIRRDFTKNRSLLENPTWQIYLLAASTTSLMIWIPTLSTIGAAVSVSYLLFKGLLVGGFTWIDIKAPIGALVSAAIIAIYQYRVYRSEREGYANRRMRLARSI